MSESSSDNKSQLSSVSRISSDTTFNTQNAQDGKVVDLLLSMKFGPIPGPTFLCLRFLICGLM